MFSVFNPKSVSTTYGVDNKTVSFVLCDLYSCSFYTWRHFYCSEKYLDVRKNRGLLIFVAKQAVWCVDF